MFDLSDPQKRERLLVIFAGIVLCVIVMMVLPGQFGELTRLNNEQEALRTKIDDLKRHDRIKGEVQERLSGLTSLTLASSGTSKNMAESGYQDWLMGLASGAGLGNVRVQNQPAPGVKDIYTKVVFTLNGEGRLDQIAEFLRRFHRTDYLHMITSVTPTSVARNPNMFNIQFRIEVLSLARVDTVNVPSADRATTAITDEERQMLATIRNRAILTEYIPPPPIIDGPNVDTPIIPPPPPFDHTLYCLVYAIVKADGRPQCWIDSRTEGRKFYLFEGQSFVLGTVRATIRKIEVNAERIQVAAEGGIYTIRLGNSFSDAESPSYFLTGIVDANETPWTAESTGEPHCVIIHETNDGETKYLLATGGGLPMAEVVATVRSVEPTANQIQMEAAGVVYTIRVGGSFSEFSNE